MQIPGTGPRWTELESLEWGLGTYILNQTFPSFFLPQPLWAGILKSGNSVARSAHVFPLWGLSPAQPCWEDGRQCLDWSLRVKVESLAWYRLYPEADPRWWELPALSTLECSPCPHE